MMTDALAELTPLERAVLDLLLAGEAPQLAVLRAQWAAVCWVAREMTGVGFFTTLAVPAALPRLPDCPRLAFGDVAAEMPALQHGAGFVLWIADGALDVLEGYTYDEPWPADTAGFTVRYVSEPRTLPWSLA